ncbi:MAG: hypothetical protein KDC92_12340 [Bacteroidetes bacterium]|nr:hypothetical protein [Bacteroidota bacterium]
MNWIRENNMSYYPHHFVLRSMDFSELLDSNAISQLDEYFMKFLNAETVEDFEKLGHYFD